MFLRTVFARDSPKQSNNIGALKMSLKFNYSANTSVFKTQREMMEGTAATPWCLPSSTSEERAFSSCFVFFNSMNDHRQTLSVPETPAALLMMNLVLICVTG